MKELEHDKWVGTTYGNNWMHKWLIRILKVTDVRLIYAFASVFVVPVVLIVNANSRNSIKRFYKRAFGLRGLKLFRAVYGNHCEFAQVVVDRFAMYAGKRFDIEIDGYESYHNLAKGDKGFVQLSSHIGNYEIAGYSLSAKDKRFNALVFGGEKESVMANRSVMFDGNNIRMIPMASDMSHLFVIDEALSDGEIVSMPADRVFGSQKTFILDFFGHKAAFPQGPFILAALRNVPMLFVSVMKTKSKTYRVSVSPVECSDEASPRVRAKKMAEKYVAMLESTIRQHPTQWYNYFDFWENNGSEQN